MRTALTAASKNPARTPTVRPHERAEPAGGSGRPGESQPSGRSKQPPLAGPNRSSRRQRRRRLAREQLAILLVLMLVLGATVALLAMEWLNPGVVVAGRP